MTLFFPLCLFAEVIEPPNGDHFAQPGIIVLKDGKWVGVDHLFNLTNKIEVYIEVQKSPTITEEINTEAIKTSIETLFKKGSITTKAESTPPFPFFHMLIMIIPVEKGYAVLCEGRLFESVHLDRFITEKNMYFQAITWEKQLLVIAPKDTFRAEIDKAVDEIANSFVTRYAFFEGIKNRQH